jgi:ribonuclease HI
MNDFIKIYTDGSAKGNPGPGGYGIVLKYKGKVKEIAQGYRHTTNNRMELLAVIVALESLKTSNIPIQVFSDSKYVIDSIVKKWVFSWEKKNFKGKKNRDLWERFLKIQGQFTITYNWVKGHAGHIENERCDVLAVAAAEQSSNHLIDSEFEAIEE